MDEVYDYTDHCRALGWKKSRVGFNKKGRFLWIEVDEEHMRDGSW